MTGDFKARFDPVLAAFIDRQRAGAERVGPPALALWEAVRTFTMRGGKRTRPWLSALAYAGLGGSAQERAWVAACSIELMQTFLLVHDDVMDRSDTRRGGPTVHRAFEARSGDAHAGVSQAILVGDLASAYGAEAIRDAGFDPVTTARAMALYHQIVVDECYGQALDTVGADTEAQVLSVFHFKTTRYTIEGPLHLGAVLAGTDDLQPLSDFARPLGLAFQLRDDVLDLFGDPALTGKPVGTDVREGKTTLLVLDAGAEALLATRDVPAMQAAVRTSGALDRATERCEAWLAESLVALDACGFAEPQRTELVTLAEHLVRRDA